MRKGLIITIALIVIAAVVYYLFFTDEPKAAQATTQNQKPEPLSISQNPEAFNATFGKMMDAYYTLKDDLVNWDSTKAANDAQTLKQLAQQVPYDTLKADKNIIETARSFSGEIANESETLSKAGTIEAKRRAFNTISDNLYSLLNTVRYDREVIYHAMCPMAFNDTEEAFWLSRDSTISNPYLGNKHPKYKSGMLTCGEIQDKINFAKK
jgi:hypothetical protein